MNETTRRFARLIDLSAVQATSTEADIRACAELAPSLWWQSVCDCIREVLYRFPDVRSQIAAIGACGQMHGTVLLDSAGQLVEDKALLWNDKRSQPQVDAFIVREDAERWLRHLNNPPAAAWPAFKLAWWREHYPQSAARIAKILMPKDFINFMLTGAIATDYSEASCYFLMDSESRSWSPQALELFGLRREQLPDLKLSSEVIGEVTREASTLTGLPAGIPDVRYGGHPAGFRRISARNGIRFYGDLHADHGGIAATVVAFTSQ